VSRARGRPPDMTAPRRETEAQRTETQSNQPTKASHMNSSIPLPEEHASVLPLLVAECPDDRILTKRFEANGTKHDFTAGKWFKYHQLWATTWHDLLEALTWLTEQPTMCILRGVLFEGCDDGEEYYRRKHGTEAEPATLAPGSFPWVVYDFDETAAPFDLAAPETSIRAWHSTLAPELRAAASAFYISSSAHRSATVRGKLVTWYRGPVSGPQARALANYYRADPIVGWCHQPNFFAAPVFDPGALDPLAAYRHSPIMFAGKPAEMPNRALMKAFKDRPPPKGVVLKDLPPGDQGILASLGAADEQIGKRFAIAGHLGGIMRKLGFRREACAAVLTEWIPAKELAPRLKWALEAWDKPADTVSGEVALRETVGPAHAAVIVEACRRARRPLKVVIK